MNKDTKNKTIRSKDTKINKDIRIKATKTRAIRIKGIPVSKDMVDSNMAVVDSHSQPGN